MKLARQYHRLRGEPTRTKFISRRSAYHGTTLGALSINGSPALRRNSSRCSGLLPRADAVQVPLPVLRGEAWLHAAVRGRDRRHRRERGPGDGRRRDPRAGAELGRLDRPAGRLLRPRPRDLRRQRAAAGRGRGDLWLRPRGTGSVDALRHPAGPDDLAKGITSAYAPLGAVVASERAIEPFFSEPQNVFTHGITFGGHPSPARSRWPTSRSTSGKA